MGQTAPKAEKATARKPERRAAAIAIDYDVEAPCTSGDSVGPANDPVIM